MADERVLQVQQWLNETYGNDSRFNTVNEDGKTGWSTIYALRRALQIELGIQETSNSFGPTTYSLCPTIAQGSEGNLVYIVQGGLWCKGYNPGGFTGYYGNGTYNAVKQLKTDAGFPSASGNMQRDFMRALLDMSAFTCLSGGTEEIRTIQQKLNYDYYDFYQICPCDGLYNRDMNKMLIYALQEELGISKSSATGTWGPTTISLCKSKVYSIGNSSNIVKLIRYATVCNGYSVNTASSTYDTTLDNVLKEFCTSLKITKPANKVNYTVVKSLLSSNGDTDRAALGCDTATKLTTSQIQTIKNAGYQYIGRYITNTPGGKLDKCLTRTEMENILNAGLKIVYLFQESNNSPEMFNKNKGKEQAMKAIYAMDSLGAPKNSIIYFAVDCDPIDSEINTYIIPYFSGVIDRFVDEGGNYSIGVYGTRNVCLSLKKAFSTHLNLYVSDASYGFSGNLGFTMPSDWSFDQFCTDITIGSGSGAVAIDKVGVSGADNAEYGSLRTPNESYDPTANIAIYTPTTEQKKAKGRLYVNMTDNLHVYSRIIATEDVMSGTSEKYAVPHDNDLMYTLPKYAMYVNFGVIQDEKDTTSSRPEQFHRCSYLIKFLDNQGIIKYGYIPANNSFPVYDNAGTSFTVSVSEQVAQDIQNYDYQREFTNYFVDETHSKLVSSSLTDIDGTNCYIYKLKSTVQLYNANAEYQKTLPAGTQVALTTCNTGETKNELIYIAKIFNTETKKWEKPLKSSNAFITYKLEEGCMPSDRVINN